MTYIESPNLSQKTRPYNNQQKKENFKIVNFEVAADHRVKLKENEKKDKYLDLARELKTVEHESDVYINCIWYSWYSNQRIIKWTGGHRNKTASGDHPNYCIIEITQNTEKGLGDFRIYAVTQTQVKDHQLTLM